MPINWLQALNPRQALANVHVDILGDWYRDPWSWPELAWVTNKATDRLVERLNETGSGRVVLIDVPKENFIVRPALLLDPLDRLAYQSIVDRLSLDLIGPMHGWTYGWRLSRARATRGKYTKNSTEWKHYRSRLEWLATRMPFGLTTDIVSFFGSVDIERLAHDLQGVVRADAIVGRLTDFLSSLQKLPARSGLPQRCWASSVLAHFYLRAVDDLLESNAHDFEAVGVTSPATIRWMDDIWVFDEQSLPLRLLQLQLQDVLRERGLEMNGAKTVLYEGAELAQKAKALEHSAVDQALGRDPEDDSLLKDLAAGLLSTPETASRTSLRFASTRMRKAKSFDLVGEFVDRALRMPHAADHLARLFRDSEAWRSLVGWYVTISKQHEISLTWTVYHLGTMFPSESQPPAELASYWRDSLSAGQTPLLLVPLVTQRLAAWNPAVARPVFRAAAKLPTYEHPFALRALALAGLRAGLDATEVRRFLGRFKENDLTLRYLEWVGMKAPNVAADFGGDY